MTSSAAAVGAPEHGSERPDTVKVVIVVVDGRRIGIPAGDVVEIQPAVAITPLPDVPATIEGVVDLRGDLIPVLGGRVRLGAGARDVQLSDRLVVVRTRARLLALRVDAALSVEDVSVLDLAQATSITGRELAGVGLARLDDGVLVVHDVEAFLSVEEIADLEGALARIEGR